MTITLAELPPGAAALVIGVTKKGAIYSRLLDLGLVPGTLVKTLRRSPLGEPTAYHIRDAVIALRVGEAELIQIHPLGEE